jgi:hypothetical protein
MIPLLRWVLEIYLIISSTVTIGLIGTGFYEDITRGNPDPKFGYNITNSLFWFVILLSLPFVNLIVIVLIIDARHRSNGKL